MVERPGRDHQQRQARLQRDGAGRADRAIAAGHPEDPCPACCPAQLAARSSPACVSMISACGSSARSRPASPADAVPADSVDRQDEAFARGRRGCRPRRPDGGRRDRGAPRPPVQRPRARTSTDHEPGEHVGGVVHAGDHPGRSHRPGKSDDGHGESRLLQRHPGREGSRGCGVTGRERPGPGSPRSWREAGTLTSGRSRAAIPLAAMLAPRSPLPGRRCRARQPGAPTCPRSPTARRPARSTASHDWPGGSAWASPGRAAGSRAPRRAAGRRGPRPGQRLSDPGGTGWCPGHRSSCLAGAVGASHILNSCGCGTAGRRKLPDHAG